MLLAAAITISYCTELHSKNVATQACLGSVKWVQAALLVLILIVGLQM